MRVAPRPVIPEWMDIIADNGYIRLDEIMEIFKVKQSAIWRWTKSGKLPTPKQDIHCGFYRNLNRYWLMSDIRKCVKDWK